jgi:hypothetical protein
MLAELVEWIEIAGERMQAAGTAMARRRASFAI